MSVHWPRESDYESAYRLRAEKAEAEVARLEARIAELQRERDEWMRLAQANAASWWKARCERLESAARALLSVPSDPGDWSRELQQAKTVLYEALAEEPHADVAGTA